MRSAMTRRVLIMVHVLVDGGRSRGSAPLSINESWCVRHPPVARRGACTVAADLAEEHMNGSRCSVRFLVFSASLRRESYKTRPASLAASVLEDKGATV